MSTSQCKLVVTAGELQDFLAPLKPQENPPGSQWTRILPWNNALNQKAEVAELLLINIAESYFSFFFLIPLLICNYFGNANCPL